MGIDLHPFLVHFPIAFLFTYCIFEIFRFKRLLALPSWFYIKGAILGIGVLGGMVALQSGELLEHKFDSTALKALVEIHAFWGSATISIFSVLVAAYAVRWFIMAGWDQSIYHLPVIGNIFRLVSPILNVLSKWLIDSPLAALIAIIGLVALLITGTLGGAIVYGPNADPFVYFVYNLFF
ncbi:MAG: hypothetical protein HZC14_03745 [Candidatus Niyogibacteria bacterium]|nr:hypothetical protein [Candidatus Niyogibacteria bacterium]